MRLPFSQQQLLIILYNCYFPHIGVSLHNPNPENRHVDILHGAAMTNWEWGLCLMKQRNWDILSFSRESTDVPAKPETISQLLSLWNYWKHVRSRRNFSGGWGRKPFDAKAWVSVNAPVSHAVFHMQSASLSSEIWRKLPVNFENGYCIGPK